LGCGLYNNNVKWYLTTTAKGAKMQTQTKTNYILEAADVSQAYRSNKADLCACGCAGTYYEPNETFFPTGLIKIVDRLNREMDKVEIYRGFGNEVIFELTYGQNSVLRAYVNTDELTEKHQEQLLEIAGK
jgi:hypothetical protein